jgi:type I restriction enzyme S subunit
MVPSGWKLSTIEEIANVSSGGTPSRKNDTYWNGNIPWVTTAEVQFKVIKDTSEKITEEGLANSSAKLFPVDTILMAMYGQGKTRGQVAKLGIEASTNQACAAIVLHTDYEVDYYYQFLVSQYENIREMANSGGQENLSGGIVKSIQVPVPPLPEQKKIAQILSTWDKAITTTEQLLANSQQQKKALMQQLLTGKKRLLDKNGVRFSGEWKNKQLSEVANVYQPKTISQSMLTDTGYPVYGANGIIGFYGEFNHENEQIAVTCRGSTCGVVNWTQAKSWITGNAMVINTDNTPSVSKRFLFYVLDGSNLSYLISGSGQPQITGNIKTHIINIPVLKEQQRIATVLSTADQEITALQQKLHALKQEKKALMQQLLTGKRRVKIQ